MSAIAGIVHWGGQPINCNTLTTMIHTLSRRGPDRVDLWQEGAIGLGHGMLWTTPESLMETLPLVKGAYAITADARLDNRENLIAALGLTPTPLLPLTDSELILAAYLRWEEQCPQQLLGDFAFAIWDGHRQQLFCARDAIGIKPFYYYHSGSTFLFASETKGLLCLPEVPQRLNEAKLADYLLQIPADEQATFYQDIYRLPAAHTLTVTARGLKLHRYWNLELKRELRLKSENEYAEAYREIFTAAVHCRLRSAFPIGAMLSGGLDSSSIVCTARSYVEQPLHTFSLIFDSVPESDERPFIQAVLEGGGVIPHWIPGDQLPLLRDRAASLQAQDEPFDAPNLFLNRSAWRAAQQQGIRVLLDGLLGDNVVSHGFAYLNELAYTGRWLALAREVRALARQRDCSSWPLLWRYLWDEGVKARLPESLRHVWRRWKGYSAQATTVPTWLNPEFVQRLNLFERIQAFEADQMRRGKTAREIHYGELTCGFIPAALEVFNRGVAEYALEARLPFADQRLVEFCLAVPPNQKLNQGLSRMIVRRALPHLPDKVRWRSGKGDLGFNFIQTLAGEQAELAYLLQMTPSILGPYIDLKVLQQMQQRFATELEQLDDSTIQKLLLATTLVQWFLKLRTRHNLDPHSTLNFVKSNLGGEPYVIS